MKSKEDLTVMISNVENSAARFPRSMKTGLETSLLKKLGLDTTDFKNFQPVMNLKFYNFENNWKTGPS